MAKYVIKCGKRVVSRHRKASVARMMLRRKQKKSRKSCHLVKHAAGSKYHKRRKHYKHRAKRGPYKRRRAYQVETHSDFLFPQAAATAGYGRHRRRRRR